MNRITLTRVVTSVCALLAMSVPAFAQIEPEADHMTRNYNVPKEAAMGYAETLYPEYRKKIRNTYVPPTSCDRYCCGWIERQGLPGGAPNLTCNDGGFGELGPRGRRAIERSIY